MKIAKNKKVVSTLLTVTFLSSLVVPATAFAADSASITGSYKYIKADTGVAGGSISFTKDSAYAAAAIDTVYYEINLPAGVEITDGSAANVGGEGGSDTVTDSSVSGTMTPAAFDAGATTITFDSLDVNSDVTGNVVAEAKVWGYDNTNGVVWEYDQNVTIAKVNSGAVTVTAASPELVSVGNAQIGSKVTVKEGTPGSLENGDDVFVTILSSGVTWDTPDTVVTDASNISDSGSFTSDKILKMTIDNQSAAAAAKLEVTPAFKVTPGTTGDIKVKISGDVTTQELTVATIGQGTVEVTVKDNDNTAYLGSAKTLDTEITLNPQTTFKADDYFTMTLPKGFKFVDAADNSANLDAVELMNDDRTAWFTFSGDESADVVLSGLEITADYNAPIGNIEATCEGAVQGKVVIGKAAAPLAVTADKVNVPLKGNSVAAGNITINEATDGVLANGAVIDLTLPMGVTFAKLPSVEVTQGDLALDATDVEFGADKSIIHVNVGTASNIASTIVLSDVLYNIDNRATTGEVKLEVGQELNAVSDNALTSVSNATIVSETASKAAFVIGSTSYTVNGETKTMDVAPYIKGDRTYVPVRYVAESLGVSSDNIIWNAADRTVTLIKGNTVAQLTIGSKQLLVNGVAITMDVAPEITSDRTMLPIRFVAQALGATVSWDAAAQSASFDIK